jgi:hypothetical protein
MSTPHPRPWRKNSIFGDGPRIPLCRERRAQWKARVEFSRRAGRITSGASFVALALLQRLGQDGRCDPSHQTLADDSGESVSTVKRALKALAGRACGLVSWVRRLARAGNSVRQTSSAYQLTLGDQPRFSTGRSECQSGRQTKSLINQRLNFLPLMSDRDREAAKAALAVRRGVVEARLLTRG